jgi:transcriptional regulator with AAA-type ATPase domain
VKDKDQMLNAVRRVLPRNRGLAGQVWQETLLGEANSFLEVLEQVSRLAPLNKPVLIIGERGTGKELIASRLHFNLEGIRRFTEHLAGQ